MSSNKKIKIDRDIVFVFIIIAIFIVATLPYYKEESQRRKERIDANQNVGKHYTEAEYKYRSTCEKIILNYIGDGGNENYYCYEHQKPNGDIVYKMDKAPKRSWDN